MNETHTAAHGHNRRVAPGLPALSAIVALICAALLAVAAAPAAAHVHVEPTVAAPDEGVDFTFIVPGERDGVPTTKLEVEIPAGVSPYSVEDPPGWNHRLVERGDTVERVVWSGRLAPDGFAEFGLLASTPAEEGTLTWKALQTYGNGEVVRWIGAPDSDNPAPVTEVSDGAAGDSHEAHGESSDGEASEASGDGDDVLARVIAIVALVLAIASLALWWRTSSESRRR